MNDSSVTFTILATLSFVLPMSLARGEPVQAYSDHTDAFDTAVSDNLLGEQRGKALIPVNTNDLDGAVYENTASDLITGYNLVSDGSLINNAGFNTVIQNSGNNVLIQNAVILNIQLQ